jgi:hypothetical protein
MGLSASPLLAAQAVASHAAASAAVRTEAADAKDLAGLQLAKLEAERAKIDAESEKLREEIKKLREANASPFTAPWVTPVAALFGVLLSTGIGWYTALRNRVGSFDQKVHEARLNAYGRLMNATDALALYFPKQFVEPAVCRSAGERMRTEFFGIAGALLRSEARKRYMALADALTRAATATRLDAPSSADDYRRWIGDGKMERCRAVLGLTGTDSRTAQACATHEFGTAPAEALRRCLAGHEGDLPMLQARCPALWHAGAGQRAETAAAYLLRDYVVLQTLSSRLRTALNEDIRGRLRPAF